ncbi:MAG: M23 family metallopeptidase [Candidatus Campbellbacteria bacterium]|nr:M23 family metallopeptidase [Candidatus Campbellbacteria bacterium]
MKHGFQSQRFWRGFVFRILATVLPFVSYGALLGIYGFLPSVGAQEEFPGIHLTSLNIPLLESTGNPNPKFAVATHSNIIYGVALAYNDNPIADERRLSATSDQISTYIVREGDSLSTIADMFNVSINTIRWANDLSGKSLIRPGQTLVILPVTGIQHIVKKGDTVKSIAKKYKGDLDEILQYNGIEIDSALAVGSEIIIPDGEIVAVPSKSSVGGASRAYAGPTYAGYYMRPTRGIKTQGLHGNNGIDIGSPAGTPIWAAAAGEVIVSSSGGWNGGYGNYVVIKHDNGTQTLYSHNSSNAVSVGQTVAQGDVIGYVGSTGRSTGSHVHFEVRGATNPF